MDFQFKIANLAGKAVREAILALGKTNASNMPGAVSLKCDHNVLRKLANKKINGVKIVVVGTNGKTSTTNLIADVFEKAGRSVICNRSGANLISGITTEFLNAKPSDVAVLESDELWLKHTLPQVRADYVILLNLFRDQLDRCGEIEIVQSSIVEALCLTPQTQLIYNGDDPLCTFVAQKIDEDKRRRKSKKSIAFGISSSLNLSENSVVDTTMCQCCESMMKYDYFQYDKLGSYICPSCGFHRPDPEFDILNPSHDEKGVAFDFVDKRNSTIHHFSSQLKGAYNFYNLLAVCTVSKICNLNDEDAQKAFDLFNPKNGRLQTYHFKNKKVLLNLAKNPTGFNQNLKIIKEMVDERNKQAICFFINDKSADGHDVSWIWDVDFEELAKYENIDFFAGGLRRDDLALRLKYAGCDAVKIDDIEQCIFEDYDEVLAVANYTALPPVKQKLDQMASEDASLLKKQSTKSADGENDKNVSRTVSWRQGGKVKIAHLYPDLLNLYGDGGNILILKKRLEWMGIKSEVKRIEFDSQINLDDADMVFLGGGPDREQMLAGKELQQHADVIKKFVENEGVLLAICGGYQMLGKTWDCADKTLEGLNIIDVVTKRDAKETKRLVGNIAIKSSISNSAIVGFENHAAKTYLADEVAPFGKVISKSGSGNNGEDGLEGVIYKNLIGTYLHGPLLSKNPSIANFLIKKAIAYHNKRCSDKLEFVEIDSELEKVANQYMLKKIV